MADMWLNISPVILSVAKDLMHLNCQCAFIAGPRRHKPATNRT